MTGGTRPFGRPILDWLSRTSRLAQDARDQPRVAAARPASMLFPRRRQTGQLAKCLPTKRKMDRRVFPTQPLGTVALFAGCLGTRI